MISFTLDIFHGNSHGNFLGNFLETDSIEIIMHGSRELLLFLTSPASGLEALRRNPTIPGLFTKIILLSISSQTNTQSYTMYVAGGIKLLE